MGSWANGATCLAGAALVEVKVLHRLMQKDRDCKISEFSPAWWRYGGRILLRLVAAFTMGWALPLPDSISGVGRDVGPLTSEQALGALPGLLLNGLRAWAKGLPHELTLEGSRQPIDENNGGDRCTGSILELDSAPDGLRLSIPLDDTASAFGLSIETATGTRVRIWRREPKAS